MSLYHTARNKDDIEVLMFIGTPYRRITLAGEKRCDKQNHDSDEFGKLSRVELS